MTIGSLRGEITVKEDNEMIIEVNGVGYRLQLRLPHMKPPT